MLNEPRSAMAKLKTVEELFKGRHFDRDVVILCVRWYLRFKLSLRDLVEMMVERGLSMAHTTIMRWVQRYAPEFEKRWRVALHPAHDRGMRHRQAALAHHLHKVSQTQLKAKIPAHAQDDDVAVEVATLEQLFDSLQFGHCRPRLFSMPA